MNIPELLQRCQLELIHLGSKNLLLRKELAAVQAELGQSGKKYVLCTSKPEGQYADGVTVGKIYWVVGETDEKYRIADNYARAIGHAKGHFLSPPA